jgi:hypothetical protein
MSYSDLLKDPRWQKKRLKILERDNFECQNCGSEDNTLHVHHYKYTKTPWEIDQNYLVTLCKDCHELVQNKYNELIDSIVFSLNNLHDAGTGSDLVDTIDDIKDFVLLKDSCTTPFSSINKKKALRIMIRLFDSFEDVGWFRAMNHKGEK